MSFKTASSEITQNHIWINSRYSDTKDVGTTSVQQKSYSATPVPGTGFGQNCSVGSGRVVAGAPDKDTNGKAFIFNNDLTAPIEIAASDGTAGATFGAAVAVGTEKVVVGAPGQEQAYVYDLAGTELAILTIPVEQPLPLIPDNFGTSVACASGRVVIGAPGNNQAFVYDKDGNVYQSLASAAAALPGDTHGQTCAIGGEIIVVGAPGGLLGGTAMMYDLDGNVVSAPTGLALGAAPTTPEGVPSPVLPTDQFGASVAAASGIAAIGAPGVLLTGGAVHIYNADGTFNATLAPDDATDGAFGTSVCIAYGRIFVGAPNGAAGGAVYVYGLEPSDTETFPLIEKIVAPDTKAGDGFGTGISSVEGTNLIITAPAGGVSSEGMLYQYTYGGALEFLDMFQTFSR